LAFFGGLQLLVATFIDWTRLGTPSAFAVPLPVLWGDWGRGDPDLGWLTLALAVFAAILALMPSTSALLRIVGLVTVAVGVAFIAQVVRLMGSAGAAFSHGLAAGPYFALAGGSLMFASRD
jgi:hypothetical protein